jgi:hypothetical protein
MKMIYPSNFIKHFIDYRFLAIFLFQFVEGSNIPQKILLQSQSPLNLELFWIDLESDTFIYPYILPAIELDFSSDLHNGFFQKWHKFSKAPVFFRGSYSAQTKFKNLNYLIDGTILIEMNKFLFLQNDFKFSNNFTSNEHFDGQIPKSGLGWSGYLQNSSLSVFYSDNYLILGNGNIFTSPINSSLLINANIKPYMYIFWHQNISALKFDWSLIFLEEVNNKNRFISLHRYEYDSKIWRFGFTELSLLSYDNIGSEEMEYILPSSILLESEVNGSLNSNLMWCLDLSIKYYGYTFISELLIDDLSLDGESPQRIAFQFLVGNNQNNLRYYIKYSRLNRWVGNYYFQELRFTYYDNLLGHPLGPDAHSLEIHFKKEISQEIDFTCQLIFKEFGSSDINDWPESMLSSNDFNFGYSNEVFPSRPISNERILNLSIDYMLSAKLKTVVNFNYSTQKTDSFLIKLALTV